MKVSDVKIESAQESIVRLHDGRVITMEDALKNTFRIRLLNFGLIN